MPVTERIVQTTGRNQRAPLAAVFLAAAVLVAASPAFAKLESPIRGTIAPQAIAAKVGRTVQITVVLTTKRAFKAVEVAIELPPGVALEGGKPSDEILDFTPGNKKVFVYRVRVTKPGEQVVMVTARAKNLDPHEGWGNTFVTVINGNP